MIFGSRIKRATAEIILAVSLIGISPKFINSLNVYADEPGISVLLARAEKIKEGEKKLNKNIKETFGKEFSQKELNESILIIKNLIKEKQEFIEDLNGVVSDEIIIKKEDKIDERVLRNIRMSYNKQFKESVISQLPDKEVAIAFLKAQDKAITKKLNEDIRRLNNVLIIFEEISKLDITPEKLKITSSKELKNFCKKVYKSTNQIKEFYDFLSNEQMNLSGFKPIIIYICDEITKNIKIVNKTIKNIKDPNLITNWGDTLIHLNLTFDYFSQTLSELKKNTDDINIIKEELR